MTLIGLAIVLVSLTSTSALFCFNTRFRREFFRTAWSARMIVFLPVTVYGLSRLFLGAAVTKAMLPMALQMTLQMVFMMSAMILQWVAMMWIMSRPRIDWYMPGETTDQLTWDDYVGMDTVRKEMQILVDFVQNPDKYRKLGAKLPKGVLLLGPPGTGKTHMARILANTVNVPIAICESSSMQSPFMAIGALTIKSLYKKLRRYAHQYGASLVFFDEIDAIGMSRSGGGQQGGMPMMGMGGFMGGGAGGILNALLGCMDGINSAEGFSVKTARRFGLIPSRRKPKPATVITIGATNAPLERLDAALIRPGRFDRKITVTVAGDKGRADQIAYFLRKRPKDKTVEIDRLTSDFRGRTPVEIDTILNLGVIKAVSGGKSELTYHDINQAQWDEDAGLPQPFDLNELDQNRVAYHEAGHGVVNVLYPIQGWKCFGATIIPRGKALGMVISRQEIELHTMTKEDLSRRLLMALASRCVETEHLGIEMNGFSGDLGQATAVAIQMVSAYGMGEHMLSYQSLNQQFAPNVVREAELLVRAHFQLAQRIIHDNMPGVHALADALKSRKELDGREVEAIVLSNSRPTIESVSEEAWKLYEVLRAEQLKEGRPDAFDFSQSVPQIPETTGTKL